MPEVATMATAEDIEKEQAAKYEEIYKTTKDAVEKLRAACLKGGAASTYKLKGIFRSLDKDKSGALDKGEFTKALQKYGLTDLTQEEIDTVFGEFDKDSSGTIGLDEFWKVLQVPLSDHLRRLVWDLFEEYDGDNDRVISPDDLKPFYDLRKNKGYCKGTLSADDCYRRHLSKIEPFDKDGKVTQDEWLSYFTSLCALIGNEEKFVEVLARDWAGGRKPEADSEGRIWATLE